ncbi:hypothetical protein BGZ97_004772 [Linnemannia gamsii]|uniref:EF-hand n=1 Tax=Linnemannia gamsii TaxID=64522 RepID=A0A9P6QRC7_9FUNG|nr:hypothetical protein BGZ97_004772 [Linnemannia gamsii]
MSSTSTPSPIPFLLLGLVTGGALLYVSYWVWPPAQRRNNNNSRNNRRAAGRRQNNSNNSNRATATSSSGGQGLRRSNATRRPASQRQPPPPTGARPDDNRHYHSEASSSDEEVYRRRSHGHETDDDGDTSDHEYSALVDEDGYERLRMDDMGENKHDGLQLMNLLYAIAEDQAVKEGHIHRGITCNNCRTVPIRGLRYKCANCQDYDLCEGCEAAEVHIKSHVFMKIRIPIPPLANSRTKKLPPFYPGIPQGNTSTPDHMLQDLLQKTHFDNVELDAMYSQYLSLSTLDQDGGGITRLTFEQALGPLGLEKNLITDRIFRFFDQDDDETINFKEMACGLSVLCKGNFEEKITYAFQGYDLDGDGYISREELHEMFKAYFYLSMELIRDVVKTMETDLINNFEYQPGMPISATFTAPIPREIGVRNTNTGNGQHHGGQNGTLDETTQNREQDHLLAEWPTSPDDNSSSASPTTSLSSSGSPGMSTDRTERVYDDDERILNQRRSVDMGALPSGAYGLVGSDEFAGDTDEHDSEDDADDEEGDGSSTPGDYKHDNDFESDSPVFVSPVSVSQEPAGDLSDAEDSGVDNSGWSAAGAHLSSVNSASSQGSSVATGSNSLPTIASRTSTRTPTAITSPSAASQSTQRATVSVPDEGSSSSSSRPRKDQPLPATTSSPHPRSVSVSNINLAWDRPHYRSTSSASFGYNSHIATPSPAPAHHGNGNGVSQEASGSSSSPVLYDINNSGEVSRSTDGQQFRRPSLGTPYQSYASSSSAPAGSYANPSFFSSTFPVMESISQDAIQEMVEKTFSAIPSPSKPGFITLDEFRAYVLTDAGILGWFDALGSIF